MISARFRMFGYGSLRGAVSAGVLIGVLLCGVTGGTAPTLGLAVARADLADHHYKRALAFYESKDYPRAIREFQAAYKVRQLPRILLNIGQVYRKLGMASTALKFYEHYLRVDLQPKPEIKAEVDRYIAQTRAMLDPPDIVPLISKSRLRPPPRPWRGAVDVTLVTVPEYYPEEIDPPPELDKHGKPTIAIRGAPRPKRSAPAAMGRRRPRCSRPPRAGRVPPPCRAVLAPGRRPRWSPRPRFAMTGRCIKRAGSGASSAALPPVSSSPEWPSGFRKKPPAHHDPLPDQVGHNHA